MNAFEITPDMIRRFPFAVKASRITDADQAWIAADMAKRIKTEQRSIGNWPGGVPTTSKNSEQADIRRDDVKSQIMRCLSDGGEWSIKRLTDACGVPHYDIRACCHGLVLDGLIIQTEGNNKSTAGSFRIADEKTAHIKHLAGPGRLSAIVRLRYDRAIKLMKDGPVTSNQIRESLGITERACQNLLRDMLADYRIECVGMQGAAKLWGLK